MTPDGIAWVELSDHVVDERLPGLPIDENVVIGRLKAGHGTFYKDTDREGHFYNMYLPDKGVAIAFVVQLGRRFKKEAVVQTVFPCGRGRFESDRWRRMA